MITMKTTITMIAMKIIMMLDHADAFGFSGAWSFTTAMLGSSPVADKEELKLGESVSAGASLAMAECADLFRTDVWNCPVVAFTRVQQALASSEQGSLEASGLENNRETAFMHAIISAGVTHTISRNCSSGNLEMCGCELRHPGASGARDWKWGGCSDNLVFGEQVSKKFLDKTDRTARSFGEPKSLTNLHNNTDT